MFRWGLIGAGDIVRKRVAAALRETAGSELVAVARAQPSLTEAFATEIGATRAYSGWQDLIRDPDLDGIYIATPVNRHAEQAIAAAAAGKHVLCEKPMAMDVAECDAMIAACRAARVRLGVAYYRRFYPVLVRIGQLIDSGEIGRPVVAQINAFERFDPPPDHPRHWLVRPADAGGGPMFDFGCHRLEMLLHLFGRTRAVTGLTARVVLKREVEDTAVATLLFDNGPMATVAVTHAALKPQDTFNVFGTHGSVHVGNLNAGELRIVTAGGEHHERHAPAANLHAPLVEDFVAAVTDGRDPAVTGATGRAVAVLEETIYSGEEVKKA